MHERVAPGRAGDLHQDARAHGRVEQIEQVVLGHVDDPLEQAQVEVAADQRGHPQHGAAVAREPRDPAHDHVAQPGAHAHPGLVAVADELLDEERVAVRLLAQLAGGVRRRAGELGHLGGVEAAQRDPRERPVALEVGEDLGQRVVLVELGVAVGAEQQRGAEARRAHEVAAEQQRGAVGPVQVVDDRQHRAAAGQALDERDDRGVEVAQLALGVARTGRGEPRHAPAQLRQQAGELRPFGAQQGGQLRVGDAGQRAAQHLDPGPEREQLVLVAAPVEDGEVPRRVRHLGDQPRLADPALAGDEDDGRFARAGAPELRLQPGERLAPADERCLQRRRQAIRQRRPRRRPWASPRAAVAGGGTAGAGRASPRAPRAAACARPRTPAARRRRCRGPAAPRSGPRARTRGTAPPRPPRGRPARRAGAARRRSARRWWRSLPAARSAGPRARCASRRSSAPRGPAAARRRRSPAPRSPRSTRPASVRRRPRRALRARR